MIGKRRKGPLGQSAAGSVIVGESPRSSVLADEVILGKVRRLSLKTKRELAKDLSQVRIG